MSEVDQKVDEAIDEMIEAPMQEFNAVEVVEPEDLPPMKAAKKKAKKAAADEKEILVQKTLAFARVPEKYESQTEDLFESAPQGRPLTVMEELSWMNAKNPGDDAYAAERASRKLAFYSKAIGEELGITTEETEVLLEDFLTRHQEMALGRTPSPWTMEARDEAKKEAEGQIQVRAEEDSGAKVSVQSRTQTVGNGADSADAAVTAMTAAVQKDVAGRMPSNIEEVGFDDEVCHNYYGKNRQDDVFQKGEVRDHNRYGENGHNDLFGGTGLGNHRYYVDNRQNDLFESGCVGNHRDDAQIGHDGEFQDDPRQHRHYDKSRQNDRIGKEQALKEKRAKARLARVKALRRRRAAKAFLQATGQAIQGVGISIGNGVLKGLALTFTGTRRLLVLACLVGLFAVAVTLTMENLARTTALADKAFVKPAIAVVDAAALREVLLETAQTVTLEKLEAASRDFESLTYRVMAVIARDESLVIFKSESVVLSDMDAIVDITERVKDELRNVLGVDAAREEEGVDALDPAHESQSTDKEPSWVAKAFDRATGVVADLLAPVTAEWQAFMHRFKKHWGIGS